MKSVFIIPSCVNHNPQISLDYSPVRSLFTAEQRFEQTQETISSVREFCPTADILLFELSEVSEKQKEYFSDKADYFLHPTEENHEIFNVFRNHMNKSHGESFAILKSLFFLKNIQFPLYDIYFKLSGRYKINNTFNLHDHVNHSFNAKKHDIFLHGFFTTLFSFNVSFFDGFLDTMMITHSFTTNNYSPYSGFSLETNLMYGAYHKINYLDHLGVEGVTGPSGEMHYE